MKFVLLTAILASVVHAAVNNQAAGQVEDLMALNSLTGLDLGPILQKVKCVAPCLVEVASKLECGDQGPLQTICEAVNEGNLQSEVKECSNKNKCGISPQTFNKAISLSTRLCSKL